MAAWNGTDRYNIDIIDIIGIIDIMDIITIAYRYIYIYNLGSTMFNYIVTPQKVANAF